MQAQERRLHKGLNNAASRVSKTEKSQRKKCVIPLVAFLKVVHTATYSYNILGTERQERSFNFRS